MSIAEKIESTAAWRLQVAEEYSPDAARSLAAASILSLLVSDTGTSPEAPNSVYDAWCNDLPIDQLHRLVEFENDYLKCIGFHEFPNSLEEVLHVLRTGAEPCCQVQS